MKSNYILTNHGYNQHYFVDLREFVITEFEIIFRLCFPFFPFSIFLFFFSKRNTIFSWQNRRMKIDTFMHHNLLFSHFFYKKQTYLFFKFSSFCLSKNKKKDDCFSPKSGLCLKYIVVGNYFRSGASLCLYVCLTSQISV